MPERKSDPEFADKILQIRDPRKRMAVIWAHCRTRLVCEPDKGEKKEGRAGCGYVQRHIRKEGHRLFAENAKPKPDIDDDVGNLLTSLYCS
jgi:DNA-directed RNA polymerase II subunit RPB1